ncbi:unnamed protein product [Caenorhabditis sp. 36 PRJEB53466]|nr:unnamed protein product [Caenorhabditis sp. 36 PRJEB53466]
MLTVVRRFSRSATCSKQIFIGHNNIDVVTNVQDRENDAFWKAVGSNRTDLKSTDLKKFKEAWGPDFLQTMTFLKDTDRLVSSNAHTVYRPLESEKKKGNDENVTFMGHFWVCPDVRGKQILEINSQQCYDVGCGVGKSMACCTKASEKWASRLTGLDGGQEYLMKYYISHYDFADLRIPKHLKFDNITVKNARDVPDNDILNYDANCFKYERSKYILGQLRDDFGRVAYDKNGEVIGFGAVSVYPSGECVITPMYADEKRVAQAILKNILEEMTLNPDKYWRLQVRSNDYFDDSYGWIRPFVKTMTHRNELCKLFSDHKLVGMDFSKVFCNFHPTNCPM